MSDTAAGLLQLLALVAVLGFSWRFLGDYMARVYSSPKHWRVERWLYEAVGVDPEGDQRWPVYLRSLLAFSAAGVVLLYLIQRCQGHLPLSLGYPGVPPALAFNTAASFVANTNWQAYSGESTMGYFTQMAGLAVQNFASAAVGLAVAVALIRGFTRKATDRIGNFWVDLFRSTFRILLPIAVLSALVLVAAGAIQSLADPHSVTTLAGGAQTISGGPVASQEAIKELGTNGGGFFNANSAHPFENPNAFTNFFEIFLILLVPVALTRTFGKLVGDRRQGVAILAAMTTIFALLLAVVWGFEAHHLALEGKETRFGVPASSLFATATTGTSTGAVDSFHDSFSAISGGALILNMVLGEIAPGGVGSGLYGILVIAIMAVFLAGLMVGRTPEYLGKKIQGREIKLVSLYILATPIAVLVGAGLAMAFPGPRSAMLNGGAHGFSEVFYAFASAGNNNGSAFAGLSANTPFYNTALGIAMLFGRFLPMVFVLALAGSLARQQPVPATAGTLPTHKALFVGLLVGVILIVTGLTYFPALSLGPLAEGL
jgi:K+-transporting ATPase ATPase A chain